MVLLRHTLPDGTCHFDWLIDRHALGPEDPPPARDADERSLLALRCATRPDTGPAAFPATHLPDHRRLYLTFEGDLAAVPGTGARGTVRRLATGRAAVALGPDRWEFVGGFGSGAITHTWTVSLRGAAATVARRKVSRV